MLPAQPASVRGRFAPSPTGEVHLGSARTALFDYLFVRHHRGTHILRIDDTDQTRYVPGAMERFFADLAWLGIEFDEGPQAGGPYGPYIQSQRTERYRVAAEELLAKGYAYRCWCSPERLREMREAQMAAKQPPRYDRRCLRIQNSEFRIQNGPSVIRLLVPEGKTTFTDLVRGQIEVDHKELDDQVLLKSDGLPTYHLAAVVDDHAMQISHVLRSEEWLPSTPKHLLLYQMFGWTPPAFAHLPFILNADRRKLSKRQDGAAVWIATYRQQGYLPAALVNYLALMGWNPGDTREFFTLDELIREFSIERVHAAGAIFDPVKLKFMNAHYLRQLDNAAIGEHLRQGNFLPAELANLTSDELEKWVQISRDRMEIFGEFADLVKPLVTIGDYPAARLIFRKSDTATSRRGLEGVVEQLASASAESWASIAALHELLDKVVAESRLTNGDVFWPARVALSGLMASPSPAELLWTLGRTEALQRLKLAIGKMTPRAANQEE